MGIISMNSNKAEYMDFKADVFKIAAEILPASKLEDYNECEDPDTGDMFFWFTFFSSEEAIVDSFIRVTRDRLLGSPQLSDQLNTEAYVYSVEKSLILSHNYWSVAFGLADRYEFVENSQP